MHYRVTQAAGVQGPWKVSTAAYLYTLYDKDKHELLAFHWHPEMAGEKTPHLHLYGASSIMGMLAKVHFPTGRISLEQFLRFLIVELKVRPNRNDWESVLRQTQKKHEQFRSWS